MARHGVKGKAKNGCEKPLFLSLATGAAAILLPILYSLVWGRDTCFMEMDAKIQGD
jgi:hypothetical protein